MRDRARRARFAVRRLASSSAGRSSASGSRYSFTNIGCMAASSKRLLALTGRSIQPFTIEDRGKARRRASGISLISGPGGPLENPKRTLRSRSSSRLHAAPAGFAYLAPNLYLATGERRSEHEAKGRRNDV